MNTPLVSICCITYNHENFIRDAIEGFLMQKTNFPIEILIHDDASTDKTADIIREYEAKFPDLIKPIYQTENLYSKGGRPGKINRDRAQGKYIALCEGDDYWTDPLKLQKQVDFLEGNEDYSFTYCRFKTFIQDTGEIKNDQNESYFINGEDAIDFNFEIFYRGWHIGSQTLMFRKSMLNPNYASNYKYPRDIHMLSHLLLNGKGACLIFFGAIYRKHQGGIYSGASDYQNAKLGYLCYKEIYTQNKQIQYLKLKYIRFAQSYIDKLLQNKDYKKALLQTFLVSLKSKNIKYFLKIFKRIIYNKTKQFFRITDYRKYNHPQFYHKIKSKGISSEPRSPRLIVSLTSYPARMKTIHFTLRTLLNQTLKPDMLILWLGHNQFPNKEKDIPKKVLKLKKIGLSIEWCEDLKSYKKLIPALNKYPNDLIVTADDDIYYPINWLKLLYESYQEQPDLIHCHRAHKIKFDDNQNIMLYNQWERITSNHDASFLVFPTTGGGVIFFPNALNNDVFKENIYLKLSPHADDIWFWAMALINGTRIKVIENNISKILLINGTQETGLWETINATGQNDIQFTNIFNHYGVLKGILFSESKLK